jgi:glycosyltransferase involved in cell wall biosynthesis
MPSVTGAGYDVREAPVIGPRASNVPAPVHVLFIIDELCRLGGAERTLLRLIRLLPPEKYRASLVTFRLDPEVFHDFPCPFHFLPLRRTYDLNAAKMGLKLRRLIRSENVAIVHTFFETSDIWAAPIAKFSGVPILISSRRDLGILRASKHHLAYRFVNRFFDRVLAVSEEVRTYCVQQDGLPPEKVLTLYNGIELGQVAASDNAAVTRAALGCAGASHLIITAANIRRVKGLDVLLRAAALVQREFPRAVFLIAGGVLEPEYFRELEELTRSLALSDTVKFLGARKDVMPLLTISDVFCLPSRSEGFSNALVEAMACGLPCVATRVGGNAEALAEGESGFIVAADNPQAMAERILILLRDPELRRRMGQHGKETVESRFSAHSMITGLVAVYDELLAGRK